MSSEGNFSNIEILAGTAHPDLAIEIGEHIGIQLCPITISKFPDGEIWVKVEKSVRGRDVFVIQPTCSPVNENFCESLIILDALKRASAARITAVIPYYGYARQDKKIAGREPITARMIADMLTTGGADRILTVDLHSAQIQGFFDIPVDHLTSVGIISGHMKSWDLADSVVVSPDAGRVNMAADYAGRLGLPMAIIHKRRIGPEKTEVSHVVGEVSGKRPIIIDDMITTGATIERSVWSLLDNGCREEIKIAVTHPVFVGKAFERLANPAITEIVVTNTIPLHDNLSGKIKQVSIAPMIAEAIQIIHKNESVSRLFS